MEKIIECLDKIDCEYETITEEIKSKISIDSKTLVEPIKEEALLKNLVGLKKYTKKINDIDTEFYDKLNLLHNSWIEDYNKVYYFCVKSKSKGLLFKKKLSFHDYEKVRAYCDDLEITTNSIKQVTKNMNTKISSILIQNFLQ